VNAANEDTTAAKSAHPGGMCLVALCRSLDFHKGFLYAGPIERFDFNTLELFVSAEKMLDFMLFRLDSTHTRNC